MTSYKFKYPSLAPAHPGADIGWLKSARGRMFVPAIIQITDVPDGMSVADVATRISTTALLLTPSPDTRFVFSWEEFGAGKIVRKRADLSDAIQEACIARMEELGLNPNQVALRVEGQVSRAHVCDYLTRRSSIGSHKLQHLLTALRLQIATVQP